jgi:hypothetical protein
MLGQIIMLVVISMRCNHSFLSLSLSDEMFRHGWAFLANRAVWHNKGKMKSYGDLFRTGDVVSVTLDLDQGSFLLFPFPSPLESDSLLGWFLEWLGALGFSINGKDLGVAVEGLVGPLYPAFSLYNEDDQLSLSPPRQPSLETDLIGSSRWGTGSAERVMQRVQTLHTLLCSLQNTSIEGEEEEEDALNPQLISEFCRRWSLWRNEIGLRTLRVDGDLIVVLVSPAVCLAFTENRSTSSFP